MSSASSFRTLLLYDDNKKHYIDLKFNIKYLNDMLEGASKNPTFLPALYWFNGTQSCQLLADAYKVKFVIIANGVSTNMIVPLSGESTRQKPIVLEFNQAHFDLLEVAEDCVYPPVDRMYNRINTGWRIEDLEDDLREYMSVQVYTPPPRITEVIEIS